MQAGEVRKARSAADNPQLVDEDLFNHALATVAAADRASVALNSQRELLLQFLLGRALELALKAYLIAQGATESDLRRIGHNLEKALEVAESKGFRMNGGNEQTRNAWLGVLNANYSKKLFEYPESRTYMMLSLRDARNIVTRTVGGVAVALWGQTRYEQINETEQAVQMGLREWPQADYA